MVYSWFMHGLHVLRRKLIIEPHGWVLKLDCIQKKL